MIRTTNRKSTKKRTRLGFHPGFPSGFDPKRAEQGLGQEAIREFEPDPERACRVCGCTEMDCRQCVEKTGEPCHWVEEDLCSACVGSKRGAGKSKAKSKAKIVARA
jgi:hypothetical protein